MEVKPGYKLTEVGVIPEEWEVCYLGEKTTKVGSGITPTGGSKVYKNEGRPFIRSQNVGWGNLLLDDIVFIDDSTHETFRATEIETEDVLLNITGASIGRSAIADERVLGGNVNQHVCIIRTSQEQLLPRFLNLFLLSSVGQKQIDSFQAGGNRQGLNFGQIRSMQIPLPPTLAEQEAIAAALSDADTLIESLEQLITKKRQVKQGAMQELLTGKRRLPGFSGVWEVKRLGEIGIKFLNGGTPSTKTVEYWKGSIPWITGADVVGQKVSEVRRLITEDAVKSSATNIVEKDNLLIVTRTGVGKIAIAPFDVAISQDLTGVYLDNQQAATEYVYRYLDYHSDQLASLNQGTSIAGITRETLMSMVVLLPTLPEQTAIAVILSDMDAELFALEAKLVKARQVKQGMMQELLTGRIRLV